MKNSQLGGALRGRFQELTWREFQQVDVRLDQNSARLQHSQEMFCGMQSLQDLHRQQLLQSGTPWNDRRASKCMRAACGHSTGAELQSCHTRGNVLQSASPPGPEDRVARLVVERFHMAGRG